MARRFKIVCVMQGSGWPSGHIAIDRYWKYEGKPGGNEMCLSDDTCTPAELVSEIDNLISELEVLKLEVPNRFKQWDKLRNRPL